METPVENVTAKVESLVLEKGDGNEDLAKEKVNIESNEKVKEEKEEVAMEVEPKSGVSFPVKLDDGKQLFSVGLRKKSILGIGFKIYGFGIYVDNERLKDLLRSKIETTPAKSTQEMYQVVIDSDVELTVRMVIIYSSLTMNMVRKNLDEGLGASIKKLTGKKDEELTNKAMGQTSDDMKLPPGSVIEISRLPGYIFQTNVLGEVTNKVQSEILCRAYINMYLGDDVLDKDAKEKFGTSLLSLF